MAAPAVGHQHPRRRAGSPSGGSGQRSTGSMTSLPAFPSSDPSPTAGPTSADTARRVRLAPSPTDPPLQSRQRSTSGRCSRRPRRPARPDQVCPMADDAARTYRFSDSQRPGLMLGLAARQAVPLATGVLAMAVTLQTGLPPMAGVLGPVFGTALAFGRWRGTPVTETIAPGTRLAANRVQGSSTLVTPAACRGQLRPRATQGVTRTRTCRSRHARPRSSTSRSRA